MEMEDISGNDDPGQKLWMYSQWYNYPMNTLHNIVFVIFNFDQNQKQTEQNNKTMQQNI